MTLTCLLGMKSETTNHYVPSSSPVNIAFLRSDLNFKYESSSITYDIYVRRYLMRRPLRIIDYGMDVMLLLFLRFEISHQVIVTIPSSLFALVVTVAFTRK